MITTIGYEGATLDDFVQTLLMNEVDLLVDIRDRAQSRRPGFSKTVLCETLKSFGIGYLHLRDLGDPKEGRDAARSGQIDKFRRIFSRVLQGEPAEQALTRIINEAAASRICLLCYERDHRYCHRKMVSDILEDELGCKTHHLGVVDNERAKHIRGRMLHSRESAAT